MDGREKAALNEEIILEIINRQRWIREDELALLAEISLAMTRRTCVRLAEFNVIYRDKNPNGIFLRLKAAGAKKVGGSSGKNVEIPHTWQHDCVAIQALHFLKDTFKHAFSSEIETEAQLRRRLQTGKIGDGTLQPRNYYFEQDYGRRAGKEMRNQAREMALAAKDGRGCIASYPYPPQFCGKDHHEYIDHEYRLTVAIRQAWGDAPAPHIRLLRCIMESKLDFRLGRARKFQLIELPPMPANARIDPRRTVDEVMGYRWKHMDIINFRDHRILSTLLYQEIPTGCVLEFTESQSEDDNHQAKLDGELYSAEEDESFTDFIIRIQNEIVKMRKALGADKDANPGA
jgi:hypothetical protein